MTKNIDKKKLQIIEEINLIASEEQLDEMALYLQRIKFLAKNKDVFKGLRETISLEELIEEQNYKGIDEERFEKLVEELDIQEPIQTLLTQLNS